MSIPAAALLITGESVTIKAHGNEITFEPLGGPEDPLHFHSNTGSFDFRLSAAQVAELQYALVNFSNTGYFDREA